MRQHDSEIHDPVAQALPLQSEVQLVVDCNLFQLAEKPVAVCGNSDVAGVAAELLTTVPAALPNANRQAEYVYRYRTDKVMHST